MGVKQARALCKALQFMVDAVNMIRIDSANYLFKQPTLRPLIVEYERANMFQKLQDGEMQLTITEAWLRGSVQRDLKDGSLTLNTAQSLAETNFSEARGEARGGGTRDHPPLHTCTRALCSLSSCLLLILLCFIPLLLPVFHLLSQWPRARRRYFSTFNGCNTSRLSLHITCSSCRRSQSSQRKFAACRFVNCSRWKRGRGT